METPSVTIARPLSSSGVPQAVPCREVQAGPLALGASIATPTVTQLEVVDEEGEFTCAAALGKKADARNVVCAMALWNSASSHLVATYLASCAMHKRRATKLILSTVAALAAWVHGEDLMETEWVGNNCPQKDMSIRKLVSLKQKKCREVRFVCVIMN